MSKVQSYFSLWRCLAFILFLLGFFTYLILKLYWSDICVPLDCSIYLMGGYLAPLRTAGLVLAVVTAPFLVVPTRYFKAWLLWVFAPAAAFTLWNLSIINTNDGIGNNGWLPSTTREQAMENYLWVWLTVTLLFIMVRHYRFLSRKDKSRQ